MMHVGVQVNNCCTLPYTTCHTTHVICGSSSQPQHNYRQEISLPLLPHNFHQDSFLQHYNIGSQHTQATYSVFSFDFSEDLALYVSGYQHETLQVYRIKYRFIFIYISKGRKNKIYRTNAILQSFYRN